MNTTNTKTFALFYFKLGLLLFWGCWIGLAFATNVCDYIFAIGGLSPDWRFRSGNYVLVGSTLGIYHLSSAVQQLLFICNMIIQGSSALLFFIASYCYLRGRNAWQFINFAFALSISLWCVYLMMEEVFIAYAFEAGHRELIMLELLSLFAVHFLPTQRDG